MPDFTLSEVAAMPAAPDFTLDQLRAMTPQTAPLQPDSVGRQAGLFARESLNGVAGIPQMFTEPIRQLVTDPILGKFGAQKGAPLTANADRFSDWIGLPTPQTPTEKMIGKGVEMGMGSFGMAGLANSASSYLSSAAPRVVNGVVDFAQAAGPKVLAALGANPGTQAVAGVTGGMAGESAKDAGAGWMGQFGSTVLGGLGGAGLVSAGKSVAGAAGRVIDSLKGGGITSQVVDQKILNILVTNGVDPASVGPAILSKMRDDVSGALQTGGDLSSDAVARLADYARTGTTPTRAGITLDPYDVTMQRNAMKIAAATGSRDGRLPTIANENNSKLIGIVDGMGANQDIYGAGQTAIAGVQATDSAMAAGKTALYDNANRMNGGAIPLNRAPYVNAVFGDLANSNKLAFLPTSVSDMLNQISKGSVTVNGVDHAVPFNVNTLDNLKTMIATAGRATQDGNAKAALKIARDALERTAVNPVKTDFGGSSVVTGEGASFLSGADGEAGNLMSALNKARAAAAAHFGWQESTPSIAAALDKPNPATFIQNNVISKTADYADVAKFTAAAGDQGKDAIRSVMAQHLKDAAIGAGKDANAANFSGVNLNKALAALGDRKLALFFSPTEIESMKSAGRVGTFETFQPAGSAVNNSNTTAAVANLLQGLSKYIKPIAKAIPLGESAIVKPLDYLTLKASESPLLNIKSGLLTPQPSKGSFADGLIGPAAYSGGLLSSP